MDTSYKLAPARDKKNLPAFSDWNGLAKGVSGSVDFVALGAGLGSNYAVWSLGVSLAPESLNFMKDSKLNGRQVTHTLNVGVTTWLGPAYMLSGDRATDRYINRIKTGGF